jgi:hypothetical protein
LVVFVKQWFVVQIHHFWYGRPKNIGFYYICKYRPIGRLSCPVEKGRQLGLLRLSTCPRRLSQKQRKRRDKRLGFFFLAGGRAWNATTAASRLSGGPPWSAPAQIALNYCVLFYENHLYYVISYNIISSLCNL